jgi:hypothetical protein
MITVKNQRFVPPSQWDVQILCNHPAYQLICSMLPLLQQTDFPTVAQLTRWRETLQPDSPIAFVDAEVLKTDPRYYEVFIAETGCVPTRSHNWHDLFGALVWILFPHSKLALNSRHLAEIELHGSKNRSPLRHQLTLFDECGLLLLYTEGMSMMPAQLRQHEWTEVFLRQRHLWGQVLLPMIFGHANYEMLTRPFLGLTAKLWPLPVPEEFTNWSLHQQVSFVDTELSQQVAAFSLPEFRQQMSPLPLLGIPGWHFEAQTAAFYLDQSYFRPRRVSNPLG